MRVTQATEKRMSKSRCILINEKIVSLMCAPHFIEYSLADLYVNGSYSLPSEKLDHVH